MVIYFNNFIYMYDETPGLDWGLDWCFYGFILLWCNLLK